MPFPRLEILTGTAPGGAPAKTGFSSRRIWLFAAVFVPCMLLGQALNFTRDPLYRSTATVLTVAQPAVDQAASVEDLDVQHVAIQRQLLLGRPLLTRTLEALSETGDAPQAALSIARIRPMLSVAPVPSTHLVELAATGSDADWLPRLVNTWIESYLAYREQAVKQEVGDTLEILEEQHQSLQERLAGMRTDVREYADEHDILSQGRSQNQAHAKLEGLNQALNKARETEVQARADYDALLQALERGEPLVPESEQSALVELQVELDELRTQLREFDNRFTPQYRMVEPEFEDLPRRITKLEQAIASMLDRGQRILRAEAQQVLESATAATLELERRLLAHKREAAEFSARFEQYEAMLDDLEALEIMAREVEQRRAGIAASSLEKYPQVRVVDWAYRPHAPFHPDYTRDAVLIGIGSLLLGVLAVLLVDFLRRNPHAEAPAAEAPLTGIRVYADSRPSLESASPAPLEHQPEAALAAPPPRELTQPEIQSLWSAADAPGRCHLGLLLSGLNPDEAAAFRRQDFDPAEALVRVSGDEPRELPVAPHLQAYLRDAPEDALDRETLEAGLRLLACDAGLAASDQVGGAALRHSYVLYLVRQGARLRELHRVLGPVPPQTLALYAPYSPKGPGKPLEDVELAYPLA